MLCVSVCAVVEEVNDEQAVEDQQPKLVRCVCVFVCVCVCVSMRCIVVISGVTGGGGTAADD